MSDQNEDTLWEEASALFHSGDYDACETVLRAILAINPHALRARYNLAQLVSRGKSPRDAVPMFCDCISRRFMTEACIERVICLFINEKEFRLANRFYKGYVTPSIETERLLHLRAFALFQLKRYAECREAANQILIKNRENHEAHFILSLVAEAVGDLPDAIENIRIASYLEPKEKYVKALERLQARAKKQASQPE